MTSSIKYHDVTEVVKYNLDLPWDLCMQLAVSEILVLLAASNGRFKRDGVVFPYTVLEDYSFFPWNVPAFVIRIVE